MSGTASRIQLISLRCPNCDRARFVERQPDDHPNATVVEIPCCTPGGFDDVHFFDANGKEIIADPRLWATETLQKDNDHD